MPGASQRMNGTTFRALKVTAQVTTLEVEPESAVCDYLVASCHRQCGASGLIKTIVQGLPGMERVVNYCLVWVWLTAVVALMSSCGCGFSAVRLRSRPNRRCSSRGSPQANGTKSSPGAVAVAVLFGCEILYTEALGHRHVTTLGGTMPRGPAYVASHRRAGAVERQVWRRAAAERAASSRWPAQTWRRLIWRRCKQQ